MYKCRLFLSSVLALTILSSSSVVLSAFWDSSSGDAKAKVEVPEVSVNVAEDVPEDANASVNVEAGAGETLDLGSLDDAADDSDLESEKEEPKAPSEQEQLDSDVDATVLSDEDLKVEKAEDHEYQAEVTRLLDIIVNSLYTRKDIFLRELISNAADALEKYRLLTLTDSSDDENELSIKIRTYPSMKRLSILDTGIGMTRDDLINNLGTIAKSGTSNFVDALKGEKDANLIGQFGVGFYSAFLVADQVVVQSKHKDDKQYVWKSSAGTKYELYEDPKGNTLGEHGTQITLSLKEDAVEFLKNAKLEELVLKYSQFVRYPIYLYKVDPESKSLVWKHVNSVAPIWSRDKSTITQEEYDSFYEAISGVQEKPLTHIHFVAEGDVDFKALLYIPLRPPNPYFDHTQKSHNVKIYTRRVLVSDEELPDFIPRYLFSLYGVVDSDSFPLNVSREHLQQSRMIKVIGRKIVRNVLDAIRQLLKESNEKKQKLKADIEAATDEEAKTKLEAELKEQTPFDKFYGAFRGSLKVACYEDVANQQKIAKLLLYKTSKHKDVEISLDDYVEQMDKDQKYIYFASGDSYREIDTSPHLQQFKRRNIDVLYLLDTMDESCIAQLRKYAGKEFKSVQKGDAGFTQTDEEKKLAEQQAKLFKPLTDAMRSILNVTSVVVSQRLVDDPCAVVTPEWSMSAHMEKVVKSYVVNRSDEQEALESFAGGKSRIVEINPNHFVIIELLKRCKNQDASFIQSVELLYNAAKLASGFMVEDPRSIVEMAYGHLGTTLEADPKATIDEMLQELAKREEEEEERKKKEKEAKESSEEADSSEPKDSEEVKDEL